MLRNNPDFYTLWNYRREILMSMHADTLGLSIDVPENKIPTAAGEAGEAVRNEELQLSEDGIRRNPKSCKYH
jgi:hypothetical protein